MAETVKTIRLRLNTTPSRSIGLATASQNFLLKVLCSGVRIPPASKAVCLLVSADEKGAHIGAQFRTSGDVLTFARTHFARAERVVA